MSDWWVQLLGYVAMVIALLSVQFRHRQNILWAQIIANLAWVAHFLLLGAFTASAINFLAAIRNVVFLRFHSRAQSRVVLYLFLLLIAVVGFATWQGTVSIFALAGATFMTLALWQHNEQRIRLLLLAQAPMWLIYSMLSGSDAGVMNEILALISIVVALWRHRKQGLHKAAHEVA